MQVKTVTLGARVGIRWIVAEGLAAGDRVIVDSGQLRAGHQGRHQTVRAPTLPPSARSEATDMAAFFIRRPIVAIVIAIVTVLGGLVSLRGLPVAQFPEHRAAADHRHRPPTPAPTRVTIEQSVATPLEQQMNGVDDMLYMQSTNGNDGSMQLTVTFDIDTNPNIDQVNVQNRMAQAQPNLPTDVTQFGLTMRKITGLPMMLVVAASRRSKSYDALFLANYANINIVDALYRVAGVGEVRIFGAGDYAMRIWLKPDRLASMGITVPEVARAVQQQSTVNPPGQIGGAAGAQRART